MDSRGIDPWIGSGGRHRLNRNLIQHIHSQEIKVIANISDPLNTTILTQRWKSAHQIKLPQCWHQEWNEYITALHESHIRIKEGPMNSFGTNQTVVYILQKGATKC